LSVALHADLTDLLDFLEGNRTPLGVPRVEMALCEAALAEDAPPLFAPVALDFAAGRFRTLPEAAVRALLAVARAGHSGDDPDWIAAKRAMGAVRTAAAEARFAEGDTLLSLAPPVHVPGHMRRLRQLRDAAGLSLATIFYDAIPLSVPEHCGPALSADFARTLLALCLQVDRAVAISAAAAEEFRTWQRRLLPAIDIPCGVMPLDAPLPPVPGEAPPLPFDEGEPFVLCVSTIESRKNHLLLLHAWLTLLRRHGPRAVPRLVLAGRPGYGGAPALALIEAAPELRAKVLCLGGVSDATLHRLYGACLFTVFNSFHEGWGLPVTEALSHGKPVIAPDLPSLREAGGAAALYFTPQSEPELADLAWSLIRDPARRAALAADIPARAPLRSWRAVAEGLIAELAQPRPELPPPLGRVGALAARRIPFALEAPPPLPALPAPLSAVADLVLDGPGWGPREPVGVWLSPGEARLRFPAVPRRPMRVLLEVSGPPGGGRARLSATLPDAPPGDAFEVTLRDGEARVLELRLPAAEPGEVVLTFEALAAARPAGETRDLVLLLRGLMFCAEEDRWAVENFLGGPLGLLRLNAG
jgi:glycosyltransferase involved in cell wall biosynthesis